MDPNEIVGKPREYDVWLAPDWSDWNEKTKKGSNWTKVSVRETTYANGRVVTQVLDAQRQPITNQVLDQTTDDKQAERFRQAQTATSREQAQSERRVVRSYTGTDPATGKPATVTEYESGPPKYDEIKPTAGSQATTPRVEGTPLPGGGYDNSKPIMVQRDAQGQQVGDARPLTADERKRWELEQGIRPPGTKISEPDPKHPGWTIIKETDAQGNARTYYQNPQGQEATPPGGAGARVEEPDPKHPGWKVVKETDAQGNARTYYVNPDGKESAPPAGARISEPDQKHPGWQIVKETDAQGNSRTYYLNPQGQEATPPAEEKAPERVQDPNTKQWLERQPDGTWKPIVVQGESGKPGPSAPEIIVGEGTKALRAYQQQLNEQVASGQITTAQRDKAWNEAMQMSQTAYQEASLLENARQSDTSAGVSLANNRMSAATSGFNTALEVVTKLNGMLPEGSDLGGKAFGALLNLQFMHAERMGAYESGPAPKFRESQLPGLNSGAPRNGAASATSATSPDVRPPVSTDATSPTSAPVDAATAQAEAAQRHADATAGTDTLAEPSPVAAPEPAFRPPPPVAGEPQGSAPPSDDGWAALKAMQAAPVALGQTQPEQVPGPASGPSLTPDSGGYVPPGGRYPLDIRPPLGAPGTVGPEGQDATNTLLPSSPLSPAPALYPNTDPNMMARAPLGGGDQWAALQPFQQPQQGGGELVVGDVGEQPGDGMDDMPPALLHAQAHATPIWRMTEQQYLRYKQMGVPDELLFGLPGRRMSA